MSHAAAQVDDERVPGGEEYDSGPQLKALWGLTELMEVLGVNMNRPDFEKLLDDYHVRPIRNEKPNSKRFYPISEMPAWMVKSLLDILHFRITLANAKHAELASVTEFLRWRAEHGQKP